MFEDPHIIYEIAKQKHEELLAEAQFIRKIKSSPNFVRKKKRGLGKMILPIADLLIAAGVGLNRKFGPASDAMEDAGSDGAGP